MAKCLEQAILDFSDTLSPKEIEQTTSRIQTLYDRMVVKEGKSLGDFRKEAVTRLRVVREYHIADRARKKMDIVKHKQNIEQASRMFEAKDWFGALDSILSRTGRWKRTNVEASVESRMTEMANFFVQAMNEVSPDGKWKVLLKSGEMDRDIAQEISNLSNTKLEAVDTKNPLAKEMARGLHKVNKYFYTTLKKTGFTLNEMDGFITGLQYDGLAVRTKFKTGMDFAKYMWEKIDIKEYKVKMGIDTDEEAFKELADLYKVLSEKDFASVVPEEGTPRAAGMLNSLNKRVSRGRVLPYKGPQEFMDVYSELGQGTLYSGFYSALRKNARIVGRAEIFGTDTSTGFKKFYDLVKRKAKEAGDEKALNDLNRREHEYEARFRYSAGFTQHPADNLTAKAIAGISSYTNLVMLGKAGIVAAITDPAYGLSAANAITDDSIFHRFGAQLQANVLLVDPKQREQLANALGILVNDELVDLWKDHIGMNPDIMPNGNKGGLITMLQKANDAYSKVTLLKGGAYSARTNNARIFSIAVAEGQEKVKLQLKNYGLNDSEIDFLKNGLDETLGFKMVTPEKLSKLTPEDVKGIIGTQTRDASKVDLKDGKLSVVSAKKEWNDIDYIRYRDNIVNKYRQAVHDFAYMASPTPTKNMMYSIFGDGNPSTFMGALGRLMGVYKSFMFAVYTNVQHSMYAGSNGAKRSFMDGNLGGLILSTTIAGGAASMVYDIIGGRTPRDPTRLEFIGEAIDRGGAGGLLGSILLASYAKGKQDPVSDLAGPVVGRMYPDILELYGKGKEWELGFGDVAEKGLRWTPFSNVWFGEALIKAYLTDRIKETVNPRFRSGQAAQLERMSGSMWEQELLIGE